ncbi:WAP four-disulfide core domain protein 10A-like [Neovison vison]|uniref:WAP four-disulfide core domain protein 10A-like n=1 Tax=Neovison vison TaxID=452646 RepID=UPI001CF0099A|nr:WAP four-disulfide core domain protein 10A-like [Neogale vison]
MKWLVLQLLTLYCLVIMPVTGKLKETVEVRKKPPIYGRCVISPNVYDCKNTCQFHSDCIFGYECCYSSCGKICMRMQEIVVRTKKIVPSSSSTVVSTVVPLITSEMPTTLEGQDINST